MRRSASRRGLRSKRTKSFPRIPSAGTDRNVAKLGESTSSPPRRPRKGGMGGGLSDAMTTESRSNLNINMNNLYDPAKESVSLSALRTRSRRAPKREKSKLQFLMRSSTTNVHAPPTSLDDHKAASRAANSDQQQKNDVLFIAIESLYPTAAVMHTLLAGAFLNAPRSLRSTWIIPPIIAASAYASAKATGCEEVARRCLAISTTNGGGNNNILAGGAAVAAAKELSRRLGGGLRISKQVRDRVNSLMTSSDIEWVVYAAALPVLLATSAAASKALLTPESCPCCGNRSGGFALAATAAALSGGYGVGRTSSGASSNGSGSSNANGNIKLPSLLGVPGNHPRIGRWLTRRLGHDFPVLKNLRHSRVIRSLIYTLVKVTDNGGISCRMKCLIGYAYGVLKDDESDLDNDEWTCEWQLMASNRGLGTQLFRNVAAFVSESTLKSCHLENSPSVLEDAMPRTQQSVLIWAKECAQVIGQKNGTNKKNNNGRITSSSNQIPPAVTRAVGKYLGADLMSEIAAFVALLAALHRIYLFYGKSMGAQ